MDVLRGELKGNLNSYVPVFFAFLLAGYYLQRHRSIGRKSDRNEVDPSQDVALGEWRPCKFSYPTITPQTQSLTEIKEVPYRPFRPGAYHVNMGLRSMPWDDWIELDNQYQRYHTIRKYRIETRRDKLIGVLRDDHNPQVRGGALAGEKRTMTSRYRRCTSSANSLPRPLLET